MIKKFVVHAFQYTALIAISITYRHLSPDWKPIFPVQTFPLTFADSLSRFSNAFICTLTCLINKHVRLSTPDFTCTMFVTFSLCWFMIFENFTLCLFIAPCSFIQKKMFMLKNVVGVKQDIFP